MSLLGRACGLDPGRTYKLLRLLRVHSVVDLRKLWQLNLDRRRETNDVAARGKVRVGRDQASARHDGARRTWQADSELVDYCEGTAKTVEPGG